jgi:hypothetical protein
MAQQRERVQKQLRMGRATRVVLPRPLQKPPKHKRTPQNHLLQEEKVVKEKHNNKLFRIEIRNMAEKIPENRNEFIEKPNPEVNSGYDDISQKAAELQAELDVLKSLQEHLGSWGFTDALPLKIKNRAEEIQKMPRIRNEQNALQIAVFEDYFESLEFKGDTESRPADLLESIGDPLRKVVVDLVSIPALKEDRLKIGEMFTSLVQRVSEGERFADALFSVVQNAEEEYANESAWKEGLTLDEKSRFVVKKGE